MNIIGALVLVFFSEPGFPSVDAPKFEIPEGVVQCQSLAELEKALSPNAVFVWHHGSTFPVEFWPTFIKFLESGGSFIHLGGAPFTHPVSGPPGQRLVAPRTNRLLKDLRLNQAEYLDLMDAETRAVAGSGYSAPTRRLSQGFRCVALEPRFTDTLDFPKEDGSPGSRDARLLPMEHLFSPGEVVFPLAASVIRIERLRGRFAGGRWIFRLVNDVCTKDEFSALVQVAVLQVLDVRVDPTFAVYRPGEQPALLVRIRQPGVQPESGTYRLTICDPNGTVVFETPGTFDAARDFTHSIYPPITLRPGLYEVRVFIRELPVFVTGFWGFDPLLFASGDRLSFDSSGFRRNGVLEPLIGTTVMSRSVQRKFLFEPNPAEWNETFKELAALGTNVVRTGVWSGWKKIALDPGIVDEAWMRALEAYYLSARRHGIPVIFTFFAFVPESWGGTSPYFDPRSLDAQAEFVGAVARRFAGTREMIWDLINEPSFASPDHLWRCRPHGDTFETRAFLAWLESRFSGDPSGRSFEDVVRSRWGLGPAEPLTLPRLEDFEDRHVFGTHHPMRAKEWLHFAQDAFAKWIRHLTTAIRVAGSKAPIGVGQDEGGLVERPGPLFHHRSLDFASMHTWWFNDLQLFDCLASSGRATPLLVSETGVMQRENLDGRTFRHLETTTRLLERKLIYPFLAGAIGSIQWCYDTNPYMASDNEVSIGLRRVDGSCKPEHRVYRELATFMKRHGRGLQPLPESDVVILVPHHSSVGARPYSQQSVRTLTRVFAEDLKVIPRLVSEYRCVEDLGQPRLIVLPANTGFSSAAWEQVLNRVDQGAILVCFGAADRDDAGLPVVRTSCAARELSRVEHFVFDGSSEKTSLPIRIPDEIVQSLYGADMDSIWNDQIRGDGFIRQIGVPWDLVGRTDLLAILLKPLLVKSRITFDADGTLIPISHRTVSSELVLCFVVNESSRAEVMTIYTSPSGETTRREIPAERGMIYAVSPATGVILDQYPPSTR